jgi:hypothetical protein
MHSIPRLGARALIGWLALGVCACGGPPTSPASPGGGGEAADASGETGPRGARDIDAEATGADAGVTTTSATAKGCPSTFGESEKRAGCTLAMTAQCTYAEGACACEPPRQCGGARMREPLPGEPGVWRCGSTDPRRLDPAGCPYVPPSAGASCATAGKRCFYGACPWAGTAATCSSGAWRLQQIISPPPP